MVLTGSEAAAKARERLKKLQEAAKVTEETAAQHGGLRQRQVRERGWTREGGGRG